MSRRKGSSTGLEPVKSVTILEPCLDSREFTYTALL